MPVRALYFLLFGCIINCVISLFGGQANKMNYKLFLDLAIIIFSAKTMGIFMRKIHIPQVVGEILAGFLIGPNLLGLVSGSDLLTYLSELGVIMLMFVAGLETDLREIKKSGLIALFVAAMGVFVPLLGGYLLYSFMYGFAAPGTPKFLEAVFIGTIITATSVGITVEVLRDLGRLKGRVVMIILSAAIIDDVLGVVLLTFVIGMKDPATKPLSVVIRTVLFFVFCLIVGFIVYKLFAWLDQKYPHRRRIPIFCFAMCLFLSYAAEAFFGIADITGAFVAGVIFCNIKDAGYIARKVDVGSYMLFSPIFFSSIGIKMALSSIDSSILVFAVLFVIVALAGKAVGCSAAAKLCRLSWKDSLRIGVGMMARGEVCLIVAQKGLAAGIIPQAYFTGVILLIIVSSVLTPVLLRLLFRGNNERDDGVLPERRPTEQLQAQHADAVQ